MPARLFDGLDIAVQTGRPARNYEFVRRYRNTSASAIRVPIPTLRSGVSRQGALRHLSGLGYSCYVSRPVGIERAGLYLAIAVLLVNVLAIMALAEPGQARSIVAMLPTMARNLLILPVWLAFCRRWPDRVCTLAPGASSTCSHQPACQ